MTIDEYKAYLLGAIGALRQKTPTPSAFAEAMALVDVLAQAATSPRRQNRPRGNGDRFREFVRRYMGSRYSRFRYANGKEDLPEQMYAILRSGLIHALSLTPMQPPNGKPPVGRENSILIAADGTHLAAVTSPPHDAALFVFAPFVDDIEAAMRRVFLDASRASGLRSLIENHIRDHRPVRGFLAPISYVDPAAPLGTSATQTASGSF